MAPYPLIPLKVYPRVVHTKNKCFCRFFKSEIHPQMIVSDVTLTFIKVIINVRLCKILEYRN